MSTHNIGFYEDLTKIIFELSSNSHLISSADGDEAMKLLHVEMHVRPYVNESISNKYKTYSGQILVRQRKRERNSDVV